MNSIKTWIDCLPASDPDMEKRSFITTVTPLPPTISRNVAISFLHDHVEMIELNPLVIRHQRTTAPPNATQEEAVNCNWYEITDVMNYLPGGIAKTELSYKGGFYDLPDGLQTHVFAPAGVDMKTIWRVAGNEPGEPPEPIELGVNAPKDGLYLREDVELRCNVFLTNFVKRNLKKSHHSLVQDLIAKAHDPRYVRGSRGQGVDSPRSQSAATTSSGNRDTASFSSAPAPQSSQTSGFHTPQQHVACSCPGHIHEVMCPNYRYIPPLNSISGSNPSRGGPKTPPGRRSPYESVQKGLRPRSQPADYNKPLPVNPPGDESEGQYLSPRLYGEQVELPANALIRNSSATINEHINGSSAPAELDGVAVAYWKQQNGLVKMD